MNTYVGLCFIVDGGISLPYKRFMQHLVFLQISDSDMCVQKAYLCFHWKNGYAHAP